MRYFYTIAFFTLAVMAIAQEKIPAHDTLAAVRLENSRMLAREPGNAIQTISQADLKSYQHTDAARLLQERSPVFIKQYGPGQLASSSFRGGGAAHTALLWNGLPLNDPLNGQLDFSLLPVAFFDGIDLQLGGSSALWGSGAVGGSIHFNNTPNFDVPLRIAAQLSGGSFGFQNQLLSVAGSRGKWAGSVRVNRVRLRNDFQFQHPLFPHEAQHLMPYLNLKQNGVQAHVYRKLGQSSFFHLGYWGQSTDRNLQPTVFQWPQTAFQADAAHRFSLNFEGQRKRWIWKAQSGFFATNLIYKDSVSHLQSVTATQTGIYQMQVGYKTQRLEGQLGLHHQSQWAQFSSFDGFKHAERRPSQHQTAVFLAPQFNAFDGRLQFRATGRQAFFDGNAIPFQWSLSGHYQLWKFLKIRALTASVYRVPTLNDRFWEPGGQPDLLPEQGHNYEAGLDYHNQTPPGKISLSGQLNVFSRRVQNWIMWLPQGNFWTPQNLDNVWSRGVEWHLEIAKTYGAHQTQISLSTNYILSTSALSQLQLIYVPLYAANGRITQRYKNLELTVYQEYTGYRYTASDHSSYLEPFALMHAQLAYSIPKPRWDARVFFRLNNVFNQAFYAVAFRPMPGRFFEWGIHFSFETKTNNK